ncbi:EAL domain-containing protein, partial [Azoarcus sp. TTM-91]|uniref:putative bifunctional diguanylate cyclase/phosphodiesterase n=1 Tax=Azoarcus sp. TTM-91 TaxID=2691581 RepID=UPI001B7CF73D
RPHRMPRSRTGPAPLKRPSANEPTLFQRRGRRERIAARVFDTVHDGVVVTDASCRIVEINRAFVETSGYAREELIGRTPHLLRSGWHDSAFYEDMWSEIGSTGMWRGEIINRRRNGQLVSELVAISAVRDSSGRISHYVATYSDLSMIKEYQQRLEHLAYHDPLTQLPNRQLFSDRMEQALAQARRHGTMLAVCYLDLDGFKPINDRHGHHAGDEVLQEISTRLKANLRGGDTVARLGGDEFALLLSDITSADELETVLGRLLEVISHPVAGLEGSPLSASIGVSLFPDDGEDADTLLRHADQAMYRAKEGGRNAWRLFGSVDEVQSHKRKNLQQEIRNGLKRGEFRIHYQPVISIDNRMVVGCEGLIRWQHPTRGLLPPAAFLFAIQDTTLAREVDEWVLDAVLEQLAEWQHHDIELPASVNVSAPLLQQEELGLLLSERLARHPGLDPHLIEFEILETAALQDLSRASRIVGDCNRRGFRFALDDFGTGYSSLTYCRQLPVQALKIDRSFINEMLDDPEDRAIVEGVIGLARAFRRRVVAEGVEKPEQLTALAELGCDHVQGYGISPPLAPDDFEHWLKEYRSRHVEPA